MAAKCDPEDDVKKVLLAAKADYAQLQANIKTVHTALFRFGIESALVSSLLFKIKLPIAKDGTHKHSPDIPNCPYPAEVLARLKDCLKQATAVQSASKACI